MINFTSQHQVRPEFLTGDKSISHRALILAAISDGVCKIRNLSPCDDVRATVACLRKLGAKIYLRKNTATVYPIVKANTDVTFHCRNSGTTARLLAGVVAGLGIRAKFTGDKSLSARPMLRLLQPLQRLGAQVSFPNGCMFEIMPSVLHGGTIEAEHPSAQIKGAVLLAALCAGQCVTYRERVPTRTHTEDMIAAFGGKISTGNEITLYPCAVGAFSYSVPDDMSSAAFLMAMDLLDGVSHTYRNLCLSAERCGFLDILQKSGVRVERDVHNGCGDVRLSGKVGEIFADEQDVVNAIDEIPVLAAIALTVRGRHVFCGVEELRKKECDRVQAIIDTAHGCGQKAHFDGHSLVIESDGVVRRNVRFNSFGDHRMAMSQAVLCLSACGGGSVDDWCCEVSFPDFLKAAGVTPLSFAVVGRDVSRSLSPLLMRNLAEHAKVCCTYNAISVGGGKLKKVLQALDGANVTMPYKGLAAKIYGADIPVNTVGKNIAAQSTDGKGAERACQLHGIDLRGKSLWILGAGGAAQACVHYLSQLGCRMQIFNRTPQKAQILTEKYRLTTVPAPDGVLSFVPDCKWERAFPLPQSASFVLVAAYGGGSGLAEKASKLGITVVDGKEMLYFQGAESFALWTGTQVQNDYPSFKGDCDEITFA